MIIKAPGSYFKGISTTCFLAGGISGCPDWQSQLITLLGAKGIKDMQFLNPRRPTFRIGDWKIAEEQIKWEYAAMQEAKAIIFWFPKETLCPITLFELGAHRSTDKILLVGIEPEYQRKRDIEIQMSLAKPDLEIVYSLDELADQAAANPFFKL
jgi:hypothetical protein